MCNVEDEPVVSKEYVDDRSGGLKLVELLSLSEWRCSKIAKLTNFFKEIATLANS